MNRLFYYSIFAKYFACPKTGGEFEEGKRRSGNEIALLRAKLNFMSISTKL